MRLTKRLGLGTVLTVLTVAVLMGLVGSRPVKAVAGSWFSTANVQAVSGGSAFYFTDTGGKTVNVSIKDQNNKSVTVGFTINGNVAPQKNNTYIYTNSADFCQPADGSYPPGTYQKNSTIAVQITGNNPTTGKIVQTYINGFTQENVGVWPGQNQTNCGIVVGTGNNQQHYPVAIKQDSVSVKNSSQASGPGSNFTKSAVSNSVFKFVGNAGVIKMALPGSSGTDATFVDKQPYDKDFNYVSTSKVFCDGNGGLRTGQLNLTPTSTFDSIAIKAQTAFSYFNGSKCVSDPITISVNNPQDKLTGGITSTLAEEFAQWDTDSKGNAVIDILKCNTSDATCSTDFQMSVLQNAGNKTYVQNNSSQCGGYNVKLDSVNGYTGNFYQNGSSNCSQSNNRIVGITGTYNQAAAPATPADGGGTVSNQSCDTSTWSFGWLFCPILSGIDDVISNPHYGLDAVIQGQLNFNTNENLANSGVEPVWTAIRDISSIFLIIIMLVMVIAQALGGLGGLDAYTVRKVLPKIIIAVIAAQISWNLLIWVINVANDAGQGIADLMFFPFPGGASAMQLQNLIANLGAGAPAGITSAALFSGALVVILNPFGIAIFALAAIMAVITAVASLMIRTALIIGCVIFFPLFMMAWILPGTKKYWDMWKSNFSRLLIMFPLIMAMIAVGRIFAWIGGHNGSTGLFDVIAVLVGYFGPYFFIPKAFKWGGTLLTQANGAISGVTSKIGEGPKKILQERQKELAHQKQISAAMRLNELERGNAGFRKKFGSAIRGDKLRSGEWDPTYIGMPPGIGRKEMMRQRREKMAKFRAAVPRAEEEEIKDAFDKLTLQQATMTEDQRRDNYRRIINDGNSSSAEIQAALKQALSDRDYATVEDWVNANTNSEHGREQINTFRKLNAGELSVRVPHLLKGDLDIDPSSPNYGQHQGIMRAAGSNQQEVAQFHGRTVEAIISHLSQRAQAGDAAAGTALQGFLRTYAAATANPDVSGNINQDAANVVRRFVDEHQAVAYDPAGNPITYYRSRQGLGHVEQGPGMTYRDSLIHDPSFAQTVSTLTTNVQDGGVITPGSRSAPPPAADPTVIHLQHQTNYNVSLPPTAAITAPPAGAPPNPQREAYKASVISDESTAQTLAHSLAYDVDPAGRATHISALQELRTASVGNADRTAAYNSVITRIQQAYTQRVRDAAEHARANPPAGMTPDQAAAAASQAEQAAIAPQMQAFESMRII
ncbi:MAG TPA: hypothetical protein VFT49_03380 [Candidatus Saccharimonadales bacterium]|nr:hypothetical protein [Candidatus Saccharimonadales bacterium]